MIILVSASSMAHLLCDLLCGRSATTVYLLVRSCVAVAVKARRASSRAWSQRGSAIATITLPADGLSRATPPPSTSPPAYIPRCRSGGIVTLSKGEMWQT